MNLRTIHLEEIGSTNDYALNLVLTEPPLSDVAIIADVQTNGRGRLNGRLWISQSGNFHCSYIINLNRLDIKENNIGNLNIASTLSIKEFLTNLTGHDNIELKFPNDILIREKKLSGVLVEVSYPFAIIGIGINLSSSPIERATSILEEFNLLVKPLDIVENLYEVLLKEI